MIHVNREEILPARWSPDGSLLLWEVDGKWSPSTLTLLRIENGKVKWALDVLRTVQQAILVCTRQVAPQKYAVAKKENKGNGTAFPDGFTINVRVEEIMREVALRRTYRANRFLCLSRFMPN